MLELVAMHLILLQPCPVITRPGLHAVRAQVVWYWDQGFWNGYVRSIMHAWEHIAVKCDLANGYRCAPHVRDASACGGHVGWGLCGC
jgi:hypothetical protein